MTECNVPVSTPVICIFVAHAFHQHASSNSFSGSDSLHFPEERLVFAFSTKRFLPRDCKMLTCAKNNVDQSKSMQMNILSVDSL